VTDSQTIKPATPEEVACFADPARKDLHEYAHKLLRMWQTETNPATTYFLPVELEKDADGKVVQKFYMEAPREEEPWISGVIVVFRTLKELNEYLDLICETKDVPRESYDCWEANLILIQKTFTSIDQRWKESGENGVRVELCKVSEHGSIEFVDDLFDQTST
jgi:hypothetical protein